MSRFAILRQIMKQHRYRLIITYILFSLEMLGNLFKRLSEGTTQPVLREGAAIEVTALGIKYLSPAPTAAEWLAMPFAQALGVELR